MLTGFDGNDIQFVNKI